MEKKKIEELTPESPEEVKKNQPKETELLVEDKNSKKEAVAPEPEPEKEDSEKVGNLFTTFTKEKEMASATSTSSSKAVTPIIRPRAISEQLTKPLSSYFGGVANAESVKKAKQLIADGASYGLGGGALTFKIIKAIEILLYRISELYFSEEQRNGRDTKKRIYLLGSNTETSSSDKIEKKNEELFTGTPIGSSYPSIITTPYAFTKEVYGGVVSGTSDINKVIDELNRLEKEKRIIVNNGIIAHTRPLKDVSLYTNESGQTILHIVLSPMFANMIGRKFVRERRDILKLLKGVTKDMTLTLYELLISEMSRGFRYYHSEPKKLYEQIAKIASYKRNPKRMREDYNYSIEVLKRIRLISDYTETSTECKFIFNLNHLTEEFDSYPETRSSSIMKEPTFSSETHGKYFL